MDHNLNLLPTADEVAEANQTPHQRLFTVRQRERDLQQRIACAYDHVIHLNNELHECNLEIIHLLEEITHVCH